MERELKLIDQSIAGLLYIYVAEQSLLLHQDSRCDLTASFQVRRFAPILLFIAIVEINYPDYYGRI